MSRYLPDTSAWHRSRHPGIEAAWISRVRARDVVMCDQVRLEILFSAQNATEYETFIDELDAFRDVPCGRDQYKRALDVQRSLSRVGGLHHRSVKISDLLIAASAEAGDALVWHYDEDFDRIAEITGQPTEWIAPRGSL